MKYTVTIIFLLTFILCSCPHQMEKMINESLPPKNYKPVYMKGANTLSKVLESIESKSDSLGNISVDIRKIDDSGFPGAIELRALVFDDSGNYILGLAPPYYKGEGSYKQYWQSLNDSVLSNDYNIRDFVVREIRTNTGEPYALSFVLDHSGSMGHNRVIKLRTAVERVLRMVKPGDYVSILSFSSNILNELKLTNDRERFTSFSAKDAGIPGSSTRLYDAAIRSIEELNKADSRYQKVMILFTDGMDGNSSNSLDSVLMSAQKNDVTIYPILFGVGFASTRPMQKMAGLTGGKFYHIYTSKEFLYVFADIYITLNNYYRLSYDPPDGQDKHSVSLAMKFPGGIEPIAKGFYDQSIFRPFDPVGSVVFLNIEFESGQYVVRDSSMYLIEQVAKTMQTNKKLKLKICGHTDSDGNEDFNMGLSLNRANAVRNHLVRMGIPVRRLETEGFGETRPLVPNDSEENKQKNRRTEFVIIDN